MPTVSIIVPVYQVQSYLQKCLDSILAQTFTDFQLLLIDDGSPDDSGSICDEYALKDRRITVIHKRNGGQSSARNTGLSFITGEYLYFCDSDDWLEPNLLLLTVEKMRETSADMVRFQCDTHDGSVVHTSDFLFPKTEKCFPTEQNRLEFITDSFLEYRIGTELWLSLFLSEPFIDGSIRFPDGIDIGEDLFVIFSVLAKSRKIAFINKPLYHYRLRSDSTMGKVKNRIRLSENNTLAFRIYESCTNSYLCSHFYEIHHKMTVTALLPYFFQPRLQNIKRIKTEINAVKERELFLEQAMIACRRFNRRNRKRYGFYEGQRRNLVNRFAAYPRVLWMFFHLCLHEVLGLPFRAARKIKAKKGTKAICR